MIWSGVEWSGFCAWCVVLRGESKGGGGGGLGEGMRWAKEQSVKDE